MNIINKILKGDKVIWLVALLLGTISLVVVYSATSALVVNNYEGNTGRLLIKHGGTLLLGFIAMFGAFMIDYKHYSKLSRLLLIPIIILLFYTLLFGRSLNEASRSINILGISFQPSEWAKIILLTYLASTIVLMGDKLHDFKKMLLYIGLPIYAVVGLIFTENLSTALILFCTSMIVLFVGRIKFVHILSILGLGIAVLSILLLVDMGMTNSYNSKRLKEYEENVANGIAMEEPTLKTNRAGTWLKRLETTFEKNDSTKYDPFDNHHYQETYAKIAIATSNFTGKGPGKSEQRNFLPHPYSDFIYAIIIEEYGIFGAIFVLLLYIIFFTSVTRIVVKRPLTFGAIMAFGLGSQIVLQAMINMGVSVGLLPVTGQPLPFVSMGGSSMMATGFIFGMILSVTRNIEEETEVLETETNTEEYINDESEVESCD